MQTLPAAPGNPQVGRSAESAAPDPRTPRFPVPGPGRGGGDRDSFRLHQSTVAGRFASPNAGRRGGRPRSGPDSGSRASGTTTPAPAIGPTLSGRKETMLAL